MKWYYTSARVLITTNLCKSDKDNPLPHPGGTKDNFISCLYQLIVVCDGLAGCKNLCVGASFGDAEKILSRILQISINICMCVPIHVCAHPYTQGTSDIFRLLGSISVTM